MDEFLQRNNYRKLIKTTREKNLTVLFATNNFDEALMLCDRVIVLYLGHVMESGTARDLYMRPRHPYTRALLDAAPVPSPRATCLSCHAAKPSDPTFPAPPNGVTFESPEILKSYAERIRDQVYVSKTMPLGMRYG